MSEEKKFLTREDFIAFGRQGGLKGGKKGAEVRWGKKKKSKKKKAL